MFETYFPGRIVNSAVGRYGIIRLLTDGGFAASYEATDASGQKCLLKAYKDPIPNKHFYPWFPAYRALQQDIQRRLRNIEHQAIQTIDEFITQDIYHMVVEWAQGTSLEELYIKELEKDDSLEKPLLVAKVMMFALTKVHEQGIVHCDQKLANFFAQEDPSISARYRIKIADFDMSLLAEKPCPNPEKNYLAGTLRYFSPEHMRGQKPTFGSDVFTVGGIMLFQLLTGRYPFERAIAGVEYDYDENPLILRAVEECKIPRLSEVAPKRAARIPRALEEINHACFASRHQDRPSAKEIHQVLLGHNLPRRLVLIGGPAKLKWRLGERAVFSRRMCAAFFGTGPEIISSKQALLEPNDEKTEWFLIPQDGVVNKTMIDGKEVVGRTLLRTGMKLQVGNPASKRIGFEVQVAFETI